MRKIQRKWGKRGLTLLVVLAMCLSTFSLTALADVVEEVDIAQEAQKIIDDAAQAGKGAYDNATGNPETDLDPYDEAKGVVDGAFSDGSPSDAEKADAKAAEDKVISEGADKTDVNTEPKLDKPGSNFTGVKDAVDQSTPKDENGNNLVIDGKDEGSKTTKATQELEDRLEEWNDLMSGKEGGLKDVEGAIDEFDADLESWINDIADGYVKGEAEEKSRLQQDTEELADSMKGTYDKVDQAYDDAKEALEALQEKVPEGGANMTQGQRDALQKEIEDTIGRSLEDLQNDVADCANKVTAAEQAFEAAQDRVDELQDLIDALNELLSADPETGITREEALGAARQAWIEKRDALVGQLATAQENLAEAKTTLENAKTAQGLASQYLYDLYVMLGENDEDKWGDFDSLRDAVEAKLAELISDLQTAMTEQAQAQLAKAIIDELTEESAGIGTEFTALESAAKDAMADILAAKKALEDAEEPGEIDPADFEKALEYFEESEKIAQQEKAREDAQDVVDGLKGSLKDTNPNVDENIAKELEKVRFTEGMTPDEKKQAVKNAILRSNKYGEWGLFLAQVADKDLVNNLIKEIEKAEAARAELAELPTVDELAAQKAALEAECPQEVRDNADQIKKELGASYTDEAGYAAALAELERKYAAYAQLQSDLDSKIDAWNRLFMSRDWLTEEDYAVSADGLTGEKLNDLIGKLTADKESAQSTISGQITAQQGWLTENGTLKELEEFTKATQDAAAALSDYLGDGKTKDIEDLIKAEAALRAAMGVNEKGNLWVDESGILAEAMEYVWDQILAVEDANADVEKALTALEEAQNAYNALEEELNTLPKTIGNLDKARELQQELNAAKADLAEKVQAYYDAADKRDQAETNLQAAKDILDSINIIDDPLPPVGNTTDGGDGGDDGDDVTTPNAPGGNTPGANAPEANVPGVNAPEANAPEANVPGVNAPEANVPGANVPGVNAPEANVPGVNAPEANAPEANATEAGVPEAGGILTDIPDADVPLAAAPGAGANGANGGDAVNGANGAGDDALVDIADEDVPLAGFAGENVSETESRGTLWIILAVVGFSGVGAAAWLTLRKKERA